MAQLGLPIVSPERDDHDDGLIGALARQRATDPMRPRLHLVETDGADVKERAFSLTELFESAARAACALEGAGARAGDRVVLGLTDPRTFVAWFLGALGRGMIAVPVPPLEQLGGSAHPQLRIGGILTDCEPRVAVVESGPAFKRALSDAKLEVLEATAIDRGAPSLELSDAPRGTPAFLQYTSGSTAAPKGVVVTHANLVANLRALSEGIGIADCDRMISWLPLHHDMGLIGGVLWPLFAGAEAFVTTPFTFITKPVTWLQGITRFGISMTVAPNFAYSVCARKIPDRHLHEIDLSTLRVAICGAEPIDIGVARAFTRRFAAHGLRAQAFYPVYGLAEATLAVSVSEQGAEVRADVVDRRRLAAVGRADPAPEGAPYAQTLVSVGRALPEHVVEIRAVDTGLPCEDRQVGEVMVRGPSVTPRYWSEPAATRRELLATGDLGYLDQGLLYIVDRLKDLVIIAGQNYAPSDIEAVVADVTGVRIGRVVAFAASRPETGTEAAVVVAEVDPDAPSQWESIRRAIATSVRERIGIPCEVVLTNPGAIEKTTSGKLRRGACAASYADGTLPTLA
jgi:fatty-acyl-CoA synthase